LGVPRLSDVLEVGAWAVWLMLIPTSASAQTDAPPTLACAPPAAAQSLAERFRADALTPDTASWGGWPEGIPVPEPAAIVVETDPAVCDRVLRAYFVSDGHVGPYRDARVSVVRLGRSFVVEDRTNRAGEWQVVVFLTPDLEVVARWLQ
jgi:hypothetical protein